MRVVIDVPEFVVTLQRPVNDDMLAGIRRLSGVMEVVQLSSTRLKVRPDPTAELN